MQRARGFTLLEILVVLALIGILAAMTVFSFSGADHTRLKAEAETLRDRIRLATEESVFSHNAVGLAVYRDGYQFFHYEQARWQEMEKPQTLPDDIMLALTVDGAPLELSTRPEDEKATPQLVFLPQGEMTAFAITLSLAESEQPGLRVFTDGLGKVRLEQEGQ